MSHRFEDTAQIAENEITSYHTNNLRWADLCREELAMEAKRPVVLAAIEARLLGTTNAATGRPHSATSAGEAAKLDEEYLAHLLNQRNIVHAKKRARTEANSAFFRAKLALAQLKRTALVA